MRPSHYRPPTRAARASTARVSLRLTDDEYRVVLSRAHALGLTLSEYLRQAALREVGDAAAAR